MTAREAHTVRRAVERQARELAENQGAPPTPVSDARLAANRENAQKSTGPKSEEGKSRSSRNSFKHGLYSKDLVLPHENPSELDQLRADLRAEHQPANTTEEILVNEMVEQYWRIRRFRKYEVIAIEADSENWLDLVPRFQRAMTAAERGFQKALATLRQLQKDRGFVPATSAAAEETQSPVESANQQQQPQLTESARQHLISVGFDPEHFYRSAETPEDLATMIEFANLEFGQSPA